MRAWPVGRHDQQVAVKRSDAFSTEACCDGGRLGACETEAKGLLLTVDHKPLVDYETLGKEALLSIPTPDHYLPLLYVIGTRQQDDAVTFPVEGVDGGSISMLTVQVGG